jgi:type I restriction enzyme S subunit
MRLSNIFLHKLKTDQLPKKWELIPVGKVILESQYGTNSASIENGNTTMVGMKDIQDGKILTTKLVRVNLSDKEREKYMLHKGDLLINRTNSFDLVGKVGIFDSEEKASYASYLVKLKPNTNKISPNYLNYWLNSSIAQRNIKRIATRAVSQANINPTEFKKHCFLPLPSLFEQKAITDLLSVWDEAIEKIERLIQLKHNSYTLALTTKLSKLTKERIHVGKFAEEISVRNKKLDISQVLSVTNSKGFVLSGDQFSRQIASNNTSNYKIVRHGEYAYNPSRINVGSIARLDTWEIGILSPMYTVFKLDNTKIDSDLFYHWLNSHEAKERIKKSAQGSVRETVSFNDFCSIGFPKISLEYQKNLSAFFSLLIFEIETLKSLYIKYKTQKRGLMQKMLTGEWRIKPEIIKQYVEA